MTTLAPEELLERIWERDPTVWTGGDEAQWLGWLDEPRRMRERVGELTAFAEAAVDEFAEVFLLGIGGSSLAADVLRRAFRVESFHVLDTTHPRAIRRLEESVDLDRTLFLVASKSGSTIETRALLDYFWQRTGCRGGCFAAITDPGSPLEALGRGRGFRAVFAAEPTVVGRYSALTMFGLVPAALMGVDLDLLLERTHETVEACRGGDGNPGLELGLRLGRGWLDRRDKVCIEDREDGLALWVEQLLAESTGKRGRGLVPARGESADASDRQQAEVRVSDPYDLGQEFFRWEVATAVAAALLEVNPFDQPDVQAAKDRTTELLAAGVDPALEPHGSPDELFAQARPGDYVGVHAFVDPCDAEAAQRLDELVERARAATGCVVTLNYGPRFLHSTGQLHKGGPATGLFLQVVHDVGREVSIPDRPFGFGRLIRAQAAGDYASLQERGRRVARVRLESV